MDFLKSNATTMGTARSIDQGLKGYMVSVYNYMAIALVVTGVLSYLVGSNEALSNMVFGSGLMWLFILAPLGIAVFFMARINSMSLQTAQTLFWAYSAVMGVSLGSIFLLYTGESIARTFFITAGTFGGMSLYAYTTKKDLSSWGSFLIMGLLGLIIASLVNIFLQSPAIQFITSIAGVIIFTGLIAYDTQRIKEFYYQAPDRETASKFAVLGALCLYMDFINLFIHLLRFFGDRRS